MIQTTRHDRSRIALASAFMDPIEPHFFGPADRRLFGVYHVPEGRFRPHGVVLCPPGPQRYMRSHMALRKVAVTLARKGFHVLRFDYYGTGDSAGPSNAGTLSTWRGNIVSAVEDLADCSGSGRVSLIGFGLGAALAASVPLDVADLVLWDPVVKGPDYIEELRSLHRRQFAAILFPPQLPKPGSDGDILGLPLSQDLQSELRSLDLAADLRVKADNIALVVSEPRASYQQLRSQLAQFSRHPIDFRHIPVEAETDQQEAMLVSTALLESMAAVLTKRAS
jgi:pimeloyl-ACP methyl ester carboxylesterase